MQLPKGEINKKYCAIIAPLLNMTGIYIAVIKNQIKGGEMMGFLRAMQQMGQSEKKEGLEPYLVRPMAQGGKEIRVWLQVKGDLQETLDKLGVCGVDLADYHRKCISPK